MRSAAALDRGPQPHAAGGRTRCVVLGAGIAGLVAGLDLARSGIDVTVVEAAPFAGGRTSSWRTASGLHADTGLHVFAEHYRTLFDVLRGIGAGDDLIWWDRHQYRRPDGSEVLFRLSQLPSPFHLLYPARAMSLSAAARLRLLRAASEVAFATQDDLCRLDHVSYRDWHQQHHLDDGFLFELAEYAADATTFLTPDRVSARAVLSWLKYMFRSTRSARVGTWRRPMAEALVGPLVRAIERHGGAVRTTTAVVRLDLEQRCDGIRRVIVRRSAAVGPCYRADGHVAVTGPEEAIPADAVISALPVQALRSILDPELVRLSGLAHALTLTTVPALSVVLGFDRRIARPFHGPLLASGSSIRNVVDLDELRGLASSGLVSDRTCLQVLVGRAAERLMLSDEAIVDLVLHDLQVLHPALSAARLVDHQVGRVDAAMFAATPGTHARRPECRTGVGNFFVAGDWTRHVLNASMEGAAHSGRLAARALLQEVGLFRPQRIGVAP